MIFEWNDSILWRRGLCEEKKGRGEKCKQTSWEKINLPRHAVDQTNLRVEDVVGDGGEAHVAVAPRGAKQHALEPRPVGHGNGAGDVAELHNLSGAALHLARVAGDPAAEQGGHLHALCVVQLVHLGGERKEGKEERRVGGDFFEASAEKIEGVRGEILGFFAGQEKEGEGGIEGGKEGMGGALPAKSLVSPLSWAWTYDTLRTLRRISLNSIWRGRGGGAVSTGEAGRVVCVRAAVSPCSYTHRKACCCTC